MNLYHSVILAGCILYLWFYRKRLNESMLLFPVIILGGCAFHMLWEMKSSYILPYFLLMIPLAMIGYGNNFRVIYDYLKTRRTGKGKVVTIKEKIILICLTLAVIIGVACVSKTSPFKKTIGLNESEDAYFELYYQSGEY